MVNSSQIISSDAFRNISDIIFSRYVPKGFMKTKEAKNYELLSERGNFYLVKIKDYTLYENSIIYSNTEAINFLFEDLQQVKELQNLTLVTHESDVPITKSLYSSKPDCINKWFGINILHKNDKLIPIPIGIPGQFTDFYEKNYGVEKNLNHDKINKIYINFRDNTNSKERSGLKSYFSKKDWAIVDVDQISPDQYQENLRKYTYNLCPIGNGIDTYRIWETLVAGSIPITKDHIAFKNFKNFPIIFLKNLKINNLEAVETLSKSFDKVNFDFIYINYWEKKILESKNPKLGELEIKINQDQSLFNKRKKVFIRNENIKSNLKKIKYIFTRYTNIKNYFIFLRKKLR